jgi:hypothetical protein
MEALSFVGEGTGVRLELKCKRFEAAVIAVIGKRRSRGKWLQK